MDVTPHYRKAIREWIEWAEANCRFSEDNLLLPQDSDDESDERGIPPWTDDVEIAFEYQGVSDGSFQEAAEEILAGDPFYIPARYAILDYLRGVENSEWIGIPEDILSEKDAARKLIRHIIGLAPVEDIKAWPVAAWEIGQAGQVFDRDRAMRLFEHALAANLIQRREARLLRARHIFLAVFFDSINAALDAEYKGKIWINRYESQFVWHPTLKAHNQSHAVYQAILHIGAMLLCHDATKVRINLEPDEKSFVRIAVTDLADFDSELEMKGSLFSTILPACLYSLGRYAEAIEAYNRLLSAYTPENKPARIPLLRTVALCYEAMGDLTKADTVLWDLQRTFPNEKGVRSKRAELFRRQGDFSRAVQMLKEEAELDPDVSNQPYASLALALGEIAHDQLTGRFASAIANGFFGTKSCYRVHDRCPP